MIISFKELTIDNSLFLEEVLETSFNFDSQVAFGKNIRLGPPGYDDGSLSKKLLKDESLIKLLIRIDDQNCGCLIFTEGNPNVIRYFCLDPLFINKGIGSLVLKKFEENRKGIWQLETPDFSLRNHHFYQKNGFKKIAEKSYSEESKSFIFEKKL